MTMVSFLPMWLVAKDRPARLICEHYVGIFPKKQVKQCEQLIGWQLVKLIYQLTSLPSDGITVNSCLFYHSDVIFQSERW